jgi:type IVB pilus formation R64 PilN family outer membrane protein
MNISRTLIALLVALTLPACQTMEMQTVSKRIDTTTDEAVKLREKAQVTETPYKAYDGLIEDNGFWIGGRRVKIDPAASMLPESFKKQFTLVSATPMTLPEIAEKVTLMTGVPVQLNADAASTNQIKINYSGSLAGFFDGIVSRQGISWKYSSGSVIFYKMDSRTWRVKALPGETTLSATVTTSSSASGTSSGVSGSTGLDSAGATVGTVDSGTTGTSSSSGTGQQTASYSSTTKIWKEIEDTIKSMLTKDGKVVVSPGTNSVTVTDTKVVLDQVDTFIRDRNKNLGRQVVINVSAYSVTKNSGDQNGIDWSLVYTATKGAIKIASPFAGNNAAALTASIIDPNSRINGTSLILKALESQGKVALMTSSSVTTLNSQPVPVQVARQTGYLQSISTTTTGTSGTTQTSLTPGTVTTGFNMNLVPAIYEDGRMLLQYAISISDLAGLTSVASNGQTIQVPEINTRNFLQRVGIKSGQTLILSGFERQSDSWNKSQMFKSTLTGGGFTTSSNRDVIVIMITPVVLEDDEVI